MRKRLIFWMPVFGFTSVLAACGSDGVSGDPATVRERIDRCRGDFDECDDASEDCKANAMSCMDGVHGNGVREEHIAGECDALYDLCATKTDDLAFCEDLRQACFDCVNRYDDDDDSDDDGDTDYDDDGDTDYDDDEDTDDDGRCDRDDDEDTDDEDTDYHYGDCDGGGTGGTAGSGGMTGTGGTAGSGGAAGTGGSAGSGGMTGTGGTAGSGGMTGTGGAAGTGTTVSFATDILPYFGSQQADCVGCHRNGGPAGVDLDSYAGIVAVDPTTLINQLNRSHHNGPDDAGFVVILAQWIDEGALNN